MQFYSLNNIKKIQINVFGSAPLDGYSNKRKIYYKLNYKCDGTIFDF